MSRSVSVRSAATLRAPINHRLNLYTLAAVTAGVGAIALAQPAEGKVIVTHSNISLTDFKSAPIDLNKDGVNDFLFAISAGGYDHSFYGTLIAKPLTGGKVVAGTRGPLGPYASALVNGANIGPSDHFSSSVVRERVIIERTAGFVSGSSGHSSYGKWSHVSNHYVGVSFLINGATHYGWVRLSVGWNHGLTATITEYAYETIANRKIGAGSTTGSAEVAAVSTSDHRIPTVNGPSLGMLALGSDGLALWKRDSDSARLTEPALPRQDS